MCFYVEQYQGSQKSLARPFLTTLLFHRMHTYEHLDHPCSKPPQPLDVLMQANCIGSLWALSQ